MSANHNMQTGERIDEVFLVPYQVTNFLVQEQQHAEMAARIATQRATTTGRGTDRFLDNSLARAWYRNRPEELENDTRSGDEVGSRHRLFRCHDIDGLQSSDDSSEVPKRSSTRMRFSSARIPSTVTPSSSSKASSSRASSSRVTFRTENTGSPFIPSGHWTRKRLQEQWDKATKEAGSASVTIANEIDGEEVPGVPEDFQYLEHGYDWGKHTSDPNFLIGCDCTGNCSTADVGGCCIRHIDSDPEDLMGFWYDRRVRFLRRCGFVCDESHHPLGQGLFRLDTTHILLRECNIVSHASGKVMFFLPPAQNCSCDETCRTRVAQKPRQTPLQVFRTPHCGWGVRPAVRVPKGTLIGLYSGSAIISRFSCSQLTYRAHRVLLCVTNHFLERCCSPFHYRKRWEADRIQGERKNYIFDLDHNRYGEEGPIQNQYSVDGYTKGAPVY